MAWTSANPVSEGFSTNKAQHDALFNNFVYLKDFIWARSLFIFEAAAPTGWAIIAGCTDALLSVKGGAEEYNVNGGTKLAGSWTQDTHIHLGLQHTITEAELPSHTHSLDNNIYHEHASGLYEYYTGTASMGTNTATGIQSGTTTPTGSHLHSPTGASSLAGATWRPLANVGILIAAT